MVVAYDDLPDELAQMIENGAESSRAMKSTSRSHLITTK
jgi:hypothetical protein